MGLVALFRALHVQCFSLHCEWCHLFNFFDYTAGSHQATTQYTPIQQNASQEGRVIRRQ
jgi:hypothetical protein